MTPETPHLPSSSSPAGSPARGRTLAIGFGTTVAMWAVCYLSMINPGMVVGEILFALILACLFVGGYAAGRHLAPGESAVIAGAKLGVVVAVLNLLIVGALLVDPKTHQFQHNAGLWIAGDFGVSIVLAALGAIIGSRFAEADRAEKKKAPKPANWYNRFIIVAAVTVFLLLITGGLVTGLKAGLAVPDWPTSFGHNMLLYPLSEMSGGKYYEHAHRLYGMLVGVTAITVVVSMFFFQKKRPGLWALAFAYLVMVCIQGVMGGFRVTETSLALAIMHGMFGQIVFATIVAIAALTSKTWQSPTAATATRTAGSDRTLTTALPILLILQLGLGALYRHLNRAGATPTEPLHVLLTHVVLALLITMLIVLVAGRASSVHRDRPVLPVIGKGLLHLVGMQLLLGIGAVIVVWSRGDHGDLPTAEVIITTAHQATGALLLAFSTLLMLWTRRLLIAEPAAAQQASSAAHSTSFS